MHATRIDRKKRLAAEPRGGHNRYHPDIAPVLEVAEGEEVVLERRDSVDGQVGPDMSAADLAHLDTGLVHPLTGPVFLKGAEPGDMLEVEFLDTDGIQRHHSGHGLPPRHHDPAIRRALEDP